MNIKIKNFRNVIDLDFNINVGEINYLLGSNESGKTNLLRAIQLLDRNSNFQIRKNDYTKKGGESIDKLPYILVNDDDGRVNKIDHKNSVSYIGIKSEVRDKYFSELFKNQKTKKDFISKVNEMLIKSAEASEADKIDEVDEDEKEVIESTREFEEVDITSSNINDFPQDNFDQQPKLRSVDYYKNALDIIERIFNKERISKEDWNVILSIHILTPKMSDLKELYDNISLRYPIIEYVEPIIKAKENQNISYNYKDLFENKSIIRNIFETFLSEKYIAKLKGIKQMENEVDKAAVEMLLFEELNKNVKKYFDKFEHIKATPVFKTSGAKITLLIKSNEDWEYDSFDENERSLGFKTFLRIVIELKALSANKWNAFYIIDEPEQSLHPFLQGELINELKKMTGSKLTIILASHSPYIVQVNKFEDMMNCQYVFRGGDGSVKIRTFKDKREILKEAESFFNDSKTEHSYFLKIVYDSFGSNKIYEMLNKEIKRIKREISSGVDNDKNVKLKEDLLLFQFFLNDKA